MRAKLEEIFQKNRTKIFLGVVLTISCMIIFSSFIFGDKIFMYRDVGSDTYEQYYPYYVSIVSRLKSGTFGIWNSQHALGTSILNNLSQTLDPFGIIVILIGYIGGTEIIKYVLVFVQILKIIVAAFLCRYFLKIFDFSEMAACLGGYLYGFSGHLMLWGQHYFLGTGSIYLLILLIFLEKSIRENAFRWRAGLTITTFLSIIYSYYTSYMILLFAAIYFVFRMMYPGIGYDWIFRIKIAVKSLVSVLTGVLLSAFILIPAAVYLFNSSTRMSGNTSIVEKFFEFFFMDFFTNGHIGQAASRLMSNNMLYIDEGVLPGWGNYYEMPNVFYTVFIYILFAQFVMHFLKRVKSDWLKTVYYILCIVTVYMIILNPGVSMAFNGFVYPLGRSLFVLIPIFALITAYVWDECVLRHNISIIGIMGGMAFSAVILIYSYRRAAVDVKNYSIIYGTFIWLFAGVLVYIQIKKQTSKLILTILLGMFAITSVMDARITNNQRETLNKSEFESVGGYDDKIKSTRDAVEYIKAIDDSVYRIEKDYTDLCFLGDSMISGYASVTDYNSTVNRNLLDFYNYLYKGVMPSFAIRVFNLNNPTDIVPMQLINLKYILSKELKEINGFDFFDKVGEIYIYKSQNDGSIARWYENTISKELCSTMSEDERKKIVLNTAIVDSENDTYKTEEMGNIEIGKFVEKTSGNIVGHVNNSQSGILMLAIPHQQGWDIYVDGVQRDVFNINYGFMGVILEPGGHEIQAVYTIPYFKEGCIVSVVAISIFLVQFLYAEYRKKRCSEYKK